MVAQNAPQLNNQGLPWVHPKLYSWENPKPLVFEGRAMYLGMTARIVSARPLVFDVLDLDASIKNDAVGFCGLLTIAVVDLKLKRDLSIAKFNQIVKLSLFYGGNSEYPHGFV